MQQIALFSLVILLIAPLAQAELKNPPTGGPDIPWGEAPSSEQTVLKDELIEGRKMKTTIVPGTIATYNKIRFREVHYFYKDNELYKFCLRAPHSNARKESIRSRLVALHGEATRGARHSTQWDGDEVAMKLEDSGDRKLIIFCAWHKALSRE